MRILVTGSSGFIGTNLVAQLMRSDVEVLGVDVAEPRIEARAWRFKQLDILEADELEREFSSFRPTVVIHLAARTDLHGKSVEDYRANHIGTQVLVRAAQRTDSVERVLFCSSRLVNRIDHKPVSWTDYSPTTSYGLSKVLSEEYVRREAKNTFAWCIVRPTSIWGPWFGVPYRTFFDAVLAGRYVHPSGRAIRKSFGYVENAVDQLVALCSVSLDKLHGKTFYIADHEPIEVHAFANLIADSAKVRRPLEVPTSLLKIGAVAGDLVQMLGYREPPLTTFRLANLLSEMVYSTESLEEVVGPTQHSVEDGVRKTLKWMGVDLQ